MTKQYPNLSFLLIKSLDDSVLNTNTMIKNVNKMLCEYESFTFEYCFVRCIQNIIEDFPPIPMKEPLGEHDLISLPETNVKERACRTKRVASPDDVLSTIESIAFSNSKMLGEVKGGDANY
ncbi:hypothetical protein BDC45DRAFT_592059 [Circinella umbellata]|nr:hypothetical protein BDC45DRAFT_592059 [Circinella umbellata]